MASPHVAGVAALYLQGNPGASPATVQNGIVSTATSGRLTGIGTGSPNLLLYSLLSGGGGGCTFSISPTSANYSSSGGSGSVSVSTQAGCAWTASSNASWLTITAGASGNGSGTVNYSVASNGGASRTGSLTIAGQPFTVTQSGSGGGCVTYTGSLSGTGASQYQPNGSYYFSSVSGSHTGALVGPAGTDFDLYLQKWNGFSWSTVAQSLGTTSVENITYNGTSGYYRWRVYAYSGSGSYSLCIAHP
jgi:serine protease